MECDTCREWMSLWLDGRLVQAEIEQVEGHVATCPDCRPRRPAARRPPVERCPAGAACAWFCASFPGPAGSSASPAAHLGRDSHPGAGHAGHLAGDRRSAGPLWPGVVAVLDRRRMAGAGGRAAAESGQGLDGLAQPDPARRRRAGSLFGTPGRHRLRYRDGYLDLDLDVHRQTARAGIRPSDKRLMIRMGDL
jgi:hypothetical protein